MTSAPTVKARYVAIHAAQLAMLLLAIAVLAMLPGCFLSAEAYPNAIVDDAITSEARCYWDFMGLSGKPPGFLLLEDREFEHACFGMSDPDTGGCPHDAPDPEPWGSGGSNACDAGANRLGGCWNGEHMVTWAGYLDVGLPDNIVAHETAHAIMDPDSSHGDGFQETYQLLLSSGCPKAGEAPGIVEAPSTGVLGGW